LIEDRRQRTAITAFLIMADLREKRNKKTILID